MAGQFIQLGATPPSQAAEGFGEFVTVQKLEELERKRVRDHLENVRPALLERGIAAMRGKIAADAEVESVRRELQTTVGADGLRAALAMINEEAAKPAAAPPAGTTTDTSKKK